MSTYAERLKRIQDAVALKEPDRVPITPVNQTYPILNAGYTMADVLYDFDKGADAYLKYAEQYQPDSLWGYQYIHMGCGPMFELMQMTTCTWAGAPDGKIDKNSIHQYIEFPVLEDNEIDHFKRDSSGWLIEKAFPKISGLLEPMSKWGLSAMNPGYNTISMLADQFSSPSSKSMIETLWKISELNQEINRKTNELTQEVEKRGFPMLMKGMAMVPFDAYSDFYRGTLEGMVDMYEHEDVVTQYCETTLAQTLGFIEFQASMIPGNFVFMPLHKGMDGFMSDEQYRKFYWKDLQTIIEHIIKCGMTPYIYTEGPYNTRLECLKEVTAGKVVFHFEECDMLEAKRVLGGTACIAGGFPIYLLHYGTKQQVIDECKRLIDGCAPGGGFLFETSSGFDHAIPENVEAMYDTVKTYGKK